MPLNTDKIKELVSVKLKDIVPPIKSSLINENAKSSIKREITLRLAKN